MKSIARLLIAGLCCAAAACGTPPPPPAAPVNVARHMDIAPPPAVSTPVPIVRAKPNPNAGRSDPFVALYGANVAAPTRHVAASNYPRIPTLPGFEGPPGSHGATGSIWDTVRVTGIVQANGYSAIIEALGKSYIAREGDSIADNKIRVVAIGPGYVTLSSAQGVRNFSVGG
jgi:hypothetical protein